MTTKIPPKIPPKTNYKINVTPNTKTTKIPPNIPPNTNYTLPKTNITKKITTLLTIPKILKTTKINNIYTPTIKFITINYLLTNPQLIIPFIPKLTYPTQFK